MAPELIPVITPKEGVPIIPPNAIPKPNPKMQPTPNPIRIWFLFLKNFLIIQYYNN